MKSGWEEGPQLKAPWIDFDDILVTKFGGSPNCVIILVTNLVIHKFCWQILWPFFSPNLSLNSSPNSSPKLSLNFVYRQIRQQICHQNHQPIWWPTKFGDRNVTKIITQFGESQNKVTNMSLNFSPNLVMTKFVTKHLGVLYANRGETKYSCAFLCQVCYNQWNWISTEEHCQRHKGPIREAISDAWADLFGHRAGRGKGKRLQG